MKKRSYQTWTVIILLLLSILFFSLHFVYFGQVKNTIYYSLMSFCFIPVNTLIVSIVFDTIYARRTKMERLNKLNMLVGIFFSELGSSLLNILVKSDPNANQINIEFGDYQATKNSLFNYNYQIECVQSSCNQVKTILVNHQTILLNLMSNDSLYEHETFSDLLLATIHLRDEYLFRNNEFSREDLAHLKDDTERVYKALVLQWWDYLEHLKVSYPYLYGNALSNNPFHRATEA